MSDQWSWTLTTVQITGSNVWGPHNAVLMGGSATVAGEEAQGEDAFGAPGIIFRPRPPSAIKGTDKQTRMVGTEALAARMGDRLTPFTWRDLRLNRVFPSPKEGTIALVGYGGAFLAFDDTSEKDSLCTLYVPYARDGNGEATKCHAIILDPKQEAIAIIHSSGAAISLSKDKEITLRADENTTAVLSPGSFQVAASSIVLKGIVTVGNSPTTAVPLLAGVASPPCPSLFLSP